MAKSLYFHVFYGFLFIFFLVIASSVEGAGRPDSKASQAQEDNKELEKTEIVVPEALCEKASQTWSGNCGKTQNCDKQCIAWEGAKHGACHTRNGKHMCFCYFDHC